MRIKIENNYSTLLDNVPKETLLKIVDSCSYFIQGAQFTPAYQSGAWDGRKKLFNSASFQFPTGLVSLVTKILGYENVRYLDIRVKPQKKYSRDFEFPHKLRDYQLEAVEKSLATERGIIVLATASGKTAVAMKIAQELGVKTLFICNTKEGFYDAITTAQACFPKEKIGQYGDGRKNFGAFLTVAIMASVSASYKRKDKLFSDQNFQCIFADEVHHAGADTWSHALLNLDAYYKFGLTGTPFRSDGGRILLQASTGGIIIDKKAAELQAEGYLVPCDINFITVNEPFSLDMPMKYAEAYTHGIVRNRYRNEAIGRIVERHGGQSLLIIVEKIEHGNILIEGIKKIDSKAVFIHGTTPNREGLKKDFETGKIKTVVATRIYNESADVPILGVLVNAAGGKSGVAVIQRVGRALRLRKGKKKAVIYDFLDSFNYKLESHSIERIKWLKKEGHKIRSMEYHEIVPKDIIA